MVARVRAHMQREFWRPPNLSRAAGTSNIADRQGRCLFKTRIRHKRTRREGRTWVSFIDAGPRNPAHFMLSEMLSDREREVMRLISRGLTNKQIAGQLKLSHRTVGRYVRSIFLKLAIRNRILLMAIRHERGEAVTPTSDDDALGN
jgi:DNA-binding NarL/FixJ family response regulator